MTEAVELQVLRARFDVFMRQERAREAVDMLRNQASQHQDEPLYWAMLGQALVGDGEFTDAEAAGRRAVALSPDSSGTKITLLLALLGQRRVDEAVDLAWSIVEQHPDDPSAHHWLSRALVGRVRDRQDLIVAHQAARHALSLQADSTGFHRAAETAFLLGDDKAALEYVYAGLAENPQDRDLLLLSGQIKGGDRVGGSREEVIGGILRSNPLDATAEADLASSPLAWVGKRLFHLWYALLGVALVAVLPLPGPVAVAAALSVIALPLTLAVLSFRRLDRALPAGYLGEQLADPARGRRAFRASCAAGALVLIGGVLVTLIPGPWTTVGDVVLLLAAVVIGYGLLAVARTRARLVVADQAETSRPGSYRLVRFGDNVRSSRRYWLAALAGVVLVMVTASTGGDATGGAGMLSVGVLWTIRTLDLVGLSRALPGGENPWVRGLALSEDASKHTALRGRLLGVRYLLLLLLVCGFTSFIGYGVFIGGFIDGDQNR